MASLKNQVIAAAYSKLLQRSASGMIADGDGNPVTLNISGSELYLSGSTWLPKSITVTGSIIPEGSGSWDLGSEDNPFRDLYITSASVHFINPELPKSDPRRHTKLTAQDVDDILKGNITRKIDDDGKRLSTTERPTVTAKFINLNVKDTITAGVISASRYSGDGSGLTGVSGIDIDILQGNPFKVDAKGNFTPTEIATNSIISDYNWELDTEGDLSLKEEFFTPGGIIAGITQEELDDVVFDQRAEDIPPRDIIVNTGSFGVVKYDTLVWSGKGGGNDASAMGGAFVEDGNGDLMPSTSTTFTDVLYELDENNDLMPRP